MVRHCGGNMVAPAAAIGWLAGCSVCGGSAGRLCLTSGFGWADVWTLSSLKLNVVQQDVWVTGEHTCSSSGNSLSHLFTCSNTHTHTHTHTASTGSDSNVYLRTKQLFDPTGLDDLIAVSQMDLSSSSGVIVCFQTCSVLLRCLFSSTFWALI